MEKQGQEGDAAQHMNEKVCLNGGWSATGTNRKSSKEKKFRLV
jgi:hypothetical protein